MFIYYKFALVLGVVLSLLVLVGAAIGRRSLIFVGMIFSAIVASPITSFTRGTAGVVYVSDLVAITLLLCLIFPSTKAMFAATPPPWYRTFKWLIIIAAFSVIFVAPIFSGDLFRLGLAERVRSPIPGVPLPVLMGGFRLLRVFMYFIFFYYSANILMDEKCLRLVYKLIVAAVVTLAVFQSLTFLGVKDFGLYLPGIEYQEAHILGHAKSAAGRLYIIGIFAAIILLYRWLSATFYLAAIAVMLMGLLFSGSRAAFLGILVGFGAFGLFGKLGSKVISMMLFGLMFAGFWVLVVLDPTRLEIFAVITKAPTTNPRWIIWSWLIRYLFAHAYIFATGVGFNNFRYALAAEGVAEHGHNDMFNCVTEMGVVGLVFLFTFIYKLGRTIFSRLRSTLGQYRWEALSLAAVFAAFFVTSLFEPSFYYSIGATCMQRILAVMLGASTALWVQQQYLAEEFHDQDLVHIDEDDYYYNEAEN